MKLENFADLLLDCVQWVERRHRLLENHGYVVAANSAQRFSFTMQEVLSFEGNFAGRVRRRGVGQ